MRVKRRRKHRKEGEKRQGEGKRQGERSREREREGEREREASKLELIGGGRIGGTKRRVARSASAPQATSH